MASFANLSGIAGTVVGRGLATLHELETVYSLQDALKMEEVIKVQNYNEWVALEENKSGKR